MHLIQILLPLADNDGRPFPDALLRGIQAELSEKFGGLTAFTRVPAKGIWEHAGGRRQDDIVIVEVMTGELDRDWWSAFRGRLERLLRQEALIVRAQRLEML
jgi:hypothetical protein